MSHYLTTTAADPKETTMNTTMNTTIPDDATCPDCGELPRFRTCDRCGVSALIVDCGHMPQPRPIAASRNMDLCDECAGVTPITDEQIEALRAGAGAAGDLEQVTICDRALDGDEQARAECARVIADAAVAR